MKRLQKTILASFFIASMLVSINAAKQKRPAAEPIGFALEIIYYKGLPPAYQRVPEQDSAAKGGWYGRFRRVDSQQPSGESLPVRAVNIVSRKEGDSVRVNVSVFLGVRFHEKEVPVADYLIGENQKVYVEGLTKFGVEPFEVGVVKVTLSVESPPSVINRTESVEVIEIRSNDTVLPTYKLSLRNLSGKRIIAMEIDIIVGGRKRIFQLLQGKDGKPVVDAGQVLETNVTDATEAMMTRYGYEPDSPKNQSVSITTVVFEDYSYEGEALPAANFKALTTGRKMRLKEVVALLQSAIDSDDSKIPMELARLRAQLTSLKDNVDTAVVYETLKDFATLDHGEKLSLRSAVETALHSVKKSLLDDIESFERNHKTQPDSKVYREWLTVTTERYKQWLSRL